MVSICYQYDYDVSTLSPEGKIYQVEYATKATENSRQGDLAQAVISTIVGMVCKDGVILGTEKVVVSEMTVPASDHRIYTITKQIGMVVTGVIPDGRALVERAKEEGASFQKQYGIPISGKILAERLSQYMHMNTLYLWARPFGCTVVIAAFEEAKGPSLFMIDSGGLCYSYFGCSSGKGRQIARNEIEKLVPKNITCKEAAFNMAKM